MDIILQEKGEVDNRLVLLVEAEGYKYVHGHTSGGKSQGWMLQFHTQFLHCS